MSNRDIVIELVGRLPENTSLPEIAREIAFLSGVREAREQARRGEGVPAEEARQLVQQWAARSS